MPELKQELASLVWDQLYRRGARLVFMCLIYLINLKMFSLYKDTELENN